MADQAADDADDVRGPGVTALEASVDRTQMLLAEFRDELTRLVAKVHRDVDRLRQVALGDSPVPPPVGSERREEEDDERRLARMLGNDQAALNRAMINEVVNERFTMLDELIQARLAHSANPLRNLNVGRSRRRS